MIILYMNLPKNPQGANIWRHHAFWTTLVCRCRKIGSVLFGHGMEATNSSNCQNQFLQRCAFKYQKSSSYIVWEMEFRKKVIIILFMIFIIWISIYFSGVSLQNYLQLELALHLLMAKVHHKCATLWGVA